METILLILLVILSVALIGVILLQRGKGGGLVGFGSAGAEQAFGTHATTVAQKATVAIGALVVLIAIILGIMMSPERSGMRVLPGEPPSGRPSEPAEPAL